MSPAIDVMTKYLELAGAGDFEAATGYYVDDIVVHIPGRSKAAGELQGRQAMLDYISSALELSPAGEPEIDVVDMLASEERVALILRETFHTHDGPVVIERVNVYLVRDERIAEIWIFEANQYEVDALLGGS